ncbi:MAG: hypothetical protein ACYC6Y_11295 [Thermoguttaceae bacterium]
MNRTSCGCAARVQEPGLPVSDEFRELTFVDEDTVWTTFWYFSPAVVSAG